MAAHAGKPTEHGLDPDGYKSESTFERHIYRERERGISILIKIYTEGERDINLDEHIQRERKRKGYISI